MKTYNQLSFIVPCYNAEDTIDEAIESIYAQYINIPFEVICVNDGSTDKTEEHLLNYYSHYDNFNFVSYEKNEGEAFAANTCVENTESDLIFRLDSDNVLTANSIQPLIDLIEKTEEGAASFSTLRYFYNHTFRTDHTWEYVHTNWICDINHVIRTGTVPPASGNYLFTRESYEKAGGYPKGYGMASWGFGFRQVATGTRIAILPNSFYWHRLREDSEWRRGEQRGTNSLDCNNFVKEYAGLFTEDSQTWLFSDEARQNFFAGIDSGKLKLKGN